MIVKYLFSSSHNLAFTKNGRFSFLPKNSLSFVQCLISWVKYNVPYVWLNARRFADFGYLPVDWNPSPVSSFNRFNMNSGNRLSAAVESNLP